MPLYRCFYHIVWATKGRAPLIDAEREKVLFGLLAQKCTALNCELLAVNGMPDHVHLALAIPPAAAVASVVKQLKGTSSREINQQFSGDKPFRWQSGYSMFTISEKALPDVLAYITNQKQHHAADTIVAYYEQVGDD